MNNTFMPLFFSICSMNYNIVYLMISELSEFIANSKQELVAVKAHLCSVSYV